MKVTRSIRRGLCALALAGAPLLAASDSIDIEPYKDDERAVSRAVAEQRLHVKRLRGGGELAAAMEREAGRLRDLVRQLRDRDSQLKTADSRLRRLRQEVESKQREQAFLGQVHAQERQTYQRKWDAFMADLTRHGISRGPVPEVRIFVDDPAGAAAYNREAEKLNERQRSLHRERQELTRNQDAAMHAARKKLTDAMAESTTAFADRSRLHTGQAADARSYQSTRASLQSYFNSAADLHEREKRDAARVHLSGVPAAQSGLGPRIGAFSEQPRDTLHRLRIVKRISREAAGGAGDPAGQGSLLQEHGRPVDYGKDRAGDGFNDRGGLTDPDEGVPLVVEPGPAENPAAPAAVRDNPSLKAIATVQEKHLQRLDQLYEQRNAIVRNPQAHARGALVQVIDQISRAQGEYAMSVYENRIAAGSATVAPPPPEPEVFIDLKFPEPSPSPPPIASSQPSAP